MPPTTPPRALDRWLPHPVLSLLLAVSWLLLQHTTALVHVISALLIGLIVPRLVHGFLGGRHPFRAPLTALRLFFVVLWDIVVSNVIVARLVLGPVDRPRPRFVKVPLDVRHPTAITLLATIITTTPGTVSAVVSEPEGDRPGEILVHALDCDDEAALVASIKQRYEQPLKEIFE